MGDECIQTQQNWVIEAAISTQKCKKNTNKMSLGR